MRGTDATDNPSHFHTPSSTVALLPGSMTERKHPRSASVRNPSSGLLLRPVVTTPGRGRQWGRRLEAATAYRQI
ncbi:hypothetical protein SL003B_3135 [Polymorphum gilvum SL003B-26A1]|uniref:Uncharacterized protein n=1 Tax=Polymorphum gilvum (strain LMG 25793 / CGMCC 1.9160 / SL003B-26A1) TaxID=991905 RepID=F2IWY1_POLGS|nr:hypothetical protein SL003B_3135 [Polymorphum gilvum SL003B-26A1]